MGAFGMPELLQAINQTSRRRRRMTHMMGDFGHRKMILLCEKAEQMKLREGDVAPAELLGKRNDEIALKGRKNVRQTLGCDTLGSF